ncbi:MAG TPA: glyceraldehyde-3-phosphate dehydrogenase [Sphingobacteriaceae bacterium]|nr:glyceraldehyde-3-phosphate dehydrogenase [Sphingobacteriaceae bacterium]
MSNTYLSEFSNWIEQEKLATELINTAGRLLLNDSVELMLFRKQLYNITSSEVLAHHQYACQVSGLEINVAKTMALAAEIAELELAPSRIDMGRLTTEWINEGKDFASMADFVHKKLENHIGRDRRVLTPKDVVLFGFGRIGRIATRMLIEQTGKGEQLRLRAIVTRSYSDEELTKRAELLRNDSVHGAFLGTITEDFENQALIINGQTVKLIAANNPEDVDYTAHGISDALLIDNSGAFRDRESLGRHLKAKGISKVLLTAPAKGDVPNIVTGINDGPYHRSAETIYSNASCTTNAIVPVLKVVDDAFGIEKGHIETVHSYTNDQNLLDNYHKKYRRGRSAALNLVITETGADKAVAKVLPHLGGKLTGNAVRVPTPNVSLAILNLTLKEAVTKDSINDRLRHSALYGDLTEQIEYSVSNELVSSDLVGNSHPSIVDGPASIVSADGKSVVLYVWYDNEYGYTQQVIRLAKKISDVVRITYY